MNPHVRFQDGPFAEALDSIRRLDEKGYFYEMEIAADYYALEAEVEKICFGGGCSVMVTPNVKGETLYCRNYDYNHFPYGKITATTDLTGLDVIVHARNPQAKYESLGVADAYWLDAVGGTFFAGVLDDGKTDVSRAAIMPFVCMDGINTAGLAVGILALSPDGDWQPIDYVEYADLDDETKKATILLKREAMRPWRDVGEVENGTLVFNVYEKLGWKFVQRPSVEQKVPGRPTLTQTTLMRRFLDYCGTVEEAIALAQETNVKAPLSILNFHLVVADRSGRSVVMEWVDDKLRVNDIDHVTNFYVTRRGSRAHGGDRDQVLAAALDRWPYGMPEYAAKGALQVCAANLPLTKIGSFTYWSSIYNLSQGTLKLWHMTDYDKCYEFKL